MSSGAAAAVTSSRKPIRTGEEYIDSLRGRNLKVWLFGELVEEPVDHPIIRPSVNAVARTYDLAVQNPELATALSPFTGERNTTPSSLSPTDSPPIA